MSDEDCDAIAKFIRSKGITRCPTACVSPTQASVVLPTGRRWNNMQPHGIDQDEAVTEEIDWFVFTRDG